MPEVGLSDEDVREILRLIDESELDELRIETPGLHLHVRREPPRVEPEPDVPGGITTATAPAPAAIVPRGLHSIDSPLLGVFYRAPAPSAPPYVEAGTSVEPDTVVCLVEVMKMMNSIVAGVTGTIVEVCAENAELVEHGQPLFRVELR